MGNKEVMTAAQLMAFLENAADQYEIEDEPVLVDGAVVIDAKVQYGHVVLITNE